MTAIDFINKNKVTYLREGRPIEEQLAPGEMKFYKYINSDPNVIEVRIHINEIVGHVAATGAIEG